MKNRQLLLLGLILAGATLFLLWRMAYLKPEDVLFVQPFNTNQSRLPS